LLQVAEKTLGGSMAKNPGLKVKNDHKINRFVSILALEAFSFYIPQDAIFLSLAAWNSY